MNQKALISIVVPVCNEARNIPATHEKITSLFSTLPYRCEIIFVDDGSLDNTPVELSHLSAKDKTVKVIRLSRNFGKEAALSAGIKHATGSACLMMDGDLQHPAEKIPEFIEKWENGAQVVIGIRKNHRSGIIKRLGSYLFYLSINTISETPIKPGATDFRLIDRTVIDEFCKLTEINRMTRALIDWLGFKREYIYFNAEKRIHGKARYGFFKLLKLAISSYVAHSLMPLKLAGYLGVFIIISSSILFSFMFIEQYVLGDPWRLMFTGTAYLAVAILFLVGIILCCLGLIALYIGNIHTEVTKRPLYVISKRINLDDSAKSPQPSFRP